ncbi:MAG TPA: DUF1707 domain-containing protein [Acidimicrobiales bacterium]|nr:DUF1707 domain-containing protein [Acidimicrobiales bacterium]
MNPGVDPDDELRVSDDERERVVDDLRQHFAVGRLDVDEMRERIEQAYASRTRGDLRHAQRELPPLPAAPPRLDPAHRRALDRAGLMTVAVPSLVAVTIWYAGGHQGVFWPMWIVVLSWVAMRRRRARLNLVLAPPTSPGRRPDLAPGWPDRSPRPPGPAGPSSTEP